MNNLEIKSLRIQDYRQYKGSQKVDLSTSTGRINVIQGQNGAGKSNLLNAITLCFYGEERHQDNSGDDLESLPYVSRSALENISEGESKSGFIEVELGTEKPEYRFRRSFTTYDTGNEFANEIGDLNLQRRIGTDWKEPDNASTHLNQVLPATVSDYFFFDGEDLDSFFEGGYTDRVRSAILDVSHIELLNSSIDHIDKVQTDIERTASNLEGEAGKIRSEIDQLEEKLEEKKDEIERTKKNIQKTDDELDRIERKLQDVSDEFVRDLYKEREEHREDIKEKEENIKKLKEEATELMVKAGPVIYSEEALRFTLDHFDELSKKGQIPPKIQDWFIDELLERGQCICGAELSDDSEHAEHLRQLQNEVSEVMEENLEGKSEIPSMLKVAKEQVSQIRTSRQRIAELSDEIDDRKRKVKNITNKLKGYDIPDEEDVDIEALEEQSEELEDQKLELQSKKGRLEKEKENLENDIEGKRKELRRELEKQDRHEEVLNQLDFAEEAESELRNIKETILDEIRQNTEDNLEQYFNEIIWKEEEYEIVLHDDYAIEVLDPYGDNKIGSLSAGEKQVLALSFMAALTQISGFNAPIVIDTPLGRISSEPKRRIAKNLPKYVQDTQITFLMTDEEYTGEVQAMMEDALANEYQLEFEDNITTVEPYA